MGITKTEKFTSEQNNLANIAKALGHPARIAIIEHLLKVQACICGDLVEEIGLAQATISQHLKELKNCGLIKGNIEGTSICYCINIDKWMEFKHVLSSFFNQNPIKMNDCC
jgi:ArsR family transcriptional regulator, arsenate/arsenite/antimonite-responsive transcriptional repressor